MKSGIKTSEFWVIVVGSVVAVVVGAGVLTPDEGEAVSSATVEVINAVAALAAVLAPIIGPAIYANGRAKVKAANGNK